MRPLFIAVPTLLFIGLIFSSSVFFPEFKKMNFFEEHISELENSNNAFVESENATALSAYASKKNTAYRIEIKDLNTGNKIDVKDINTHITEDLEVRFFSKNESYRNIWKPIDNRNIYLLLRE